MAERRDRRHWDGETYKMTERPGRQTQRKQKTSGEESVRKECGVKKGRGRERDTRDRDN